VYKKLNHRFFVKNSVENVKKPHFYHSFKFFFLTDIMKVKLISLLNACLF